jgi:hypothetical protein
MSTRTVRCQDEAITITAGKKARRTTHAPDARGASAIGSERLASRALVASGRRIRVRAQETRPIVARKKSRAKQRRTAVT